MPRTSRKASHAGSWYSDDGTLLRDQINHWLTQAGAVQETPAKVIISPHAGYRYSGHVMAYAYAHIRPENVNTIFLLGPSHHHYTQDCLVSKATAYNTPHGAIQIDRDLCKQLVQNPNFRYMSSDVDEAEHSLELQLPYIWHMMRGHNFRLVPIMVGALRSSRETVYGELLGRYLDDSGSLFIISSDFCHWGSRFQYTPSDPEKGEICDFIEWMDRQGMDIIIQKDADAFRAYLQQTGNTICGRYPIAVLLQMLKYCQTDLDFRLLKYDQSGRVTKFSESSVSYVAAVGTVRQARAQVKRQRSAEDVDSPTDQPQLQS